LGKAQMIQNTSFGVKGAICHLVSSVKLGPTKTITLQRQKAALIELMQTL
jgi:hypothetical protein